MVVWYIPPLPNLHFAGQTYHDGFDCSRLSAQQRRTWGVKQDGRRRTLSKIEQITSDPQASISARLRSFNVHEYLKQYFVIDSRRRGAATNGIWEYCVFMKDQGTE